MPEVFDVMLGKQSIGKAEVIKEGLYYHIRCRCILTGQVMFQLMVTCGGQTENLGVMVPVKDAFGLETKLPVKRLGEEKLEFHAVPKHQPLEGRFVPIRKEEPFSYISQLSHGFLALRNGEVGVMLPDQVHDTSNANPTGQWSEPKTSA